MSNLEEKRRLAREELLGGNKPTRNFSQIDEALAAVEESQSAEKSEAIEETPVTSKAAPEVQSTPEITETYPDDDKEESNEALEVVEDKDIPDDDKFFDLENTEEEDTPTSLNTTPVSPLDLSNFADEKSAVDTPVIPIKTSLQVEDEPTEEIPETELTEETLDTAPIPKEETVEPAPVTPSIANTENYPHNLVTATPAAPLPTTKPAKPSTKKRRLAWSSVFFLTGSIVLFTISGILLATAFGYISLPYLSPDHQSSVTITVSNSTPYPDLQSVSSTNGEIITAAITDETGTTMSTAAFVNQFMPSAGIVSIVSDYSYGGVNVNDTVHPFVLLKFPSTQYGKVISQLTEWPRQDGISEVALLLNTPTGEYGSTENFSLLNSVVKQVKLSDATPTFMYSIEDSETIILTSDQAALELLIRSLRRGL